MTHIVVLGTGIVGSAAAWDLIRRGHEVIVADADRAAAQRVGEELGVESRSLAVASADDLEGVLRGAAAVVSAVPYAFGEAVAGAAVAAGVHYADFGGNPSIVRRQRSLDGAAREANVAIVPDCGLAPGLANVMAFGNAATLGGDNLREVRLRVGALPQRPTGSLGYQLAFNPAGLVNEYAEPCDVLIDGKAAEVEPLTDFEEVEWEGWGPLEAFNTAGGSSSLPILLAGRADSLDYKTLRFPGHGRVFAAMRELGLFSEEPDPRTGVAPRSILLQALLENLPSGEPDVVLVRTWATRHDGVSDGWQIDDRHDGRFSALARTTAFPATALIHALVEGDVGYRGVGTMDEAIDAATLLPMLESVGITAEPYRPTP